MTSPQEKAQCVSWFIETKSDVQTQKTTEVSMEETHHHVLQFVYGTRNLWRQGQCSIQGGVGDQEYLKKTSSVKASLSTFSYEVHPHCCQTIGTITFNSTQGLFHTYFCSFAGSEHLILSQ